MKHEIQEAEAGSKLFDNYGPVEVRECIGTFFLGVLALALFIALQRLWEKYADLAEARRAAE